MKAKTWAARFAALSPVTLIVAGCGAILAIVLLQEQWISTYAPPSVFWSVAMYALACLGLLLPLLGFLLAVLNVVRWRRLAECFAAFVLLVPMFLVIHTVVVRSLNPPDNLLQPLAAKTRLRPNSSVGL